MPASVADITEIATALGMLSSDLGRALREPPPELQNVLESTWRSLQESYGSGDRRALFEHAFANGRFFLNSSDGLRGRRPLTVEWSGRHRTPGDDAIPADLRVDRVYLVSCKYLSKIVMNAGPARLFDRLLIGDERSSADWFHEVAPTEYQAFYVVCREALGLAGLPDLASEIGRAEREALRDRLRPRTLPPGCVGAWRDLCAAVSENSAVRWRSAAARRRQRLELMWRMIRVTSATYFVLGASPTAALQLRVASNWDWLQDFELVDLAIEPRASGQPEVGWEAEVLDRATGASVEVRGHVEIRWSHGRFNGLPEAKVYLDTPHDAVPGYYPIVGEPDQLTLL